MPASFWQSFLDANAHAAASDANDAGQPRPSPPAHARNALNPYNMMSSAASTPSAPSPPPPVAVVAEGGGVDAEDPRKAERDLRRCEKWRDKLLANSRYPGVGPMVKFMMENLERVGCPLKKEHLLCRPCDPSRSGGFSPAVGLIHAYDYCTAHMNFYSCEQHACAEIRAANLSGLRSSSGTSVDSQQPGLRWP
ncbi:Mitochondrial inner membrane protease atp23 [Cladochytrium tenue]|nr:Mitochondrial inner membrane protease atp23 [Cladochytrium tenue]